MDYESGLAAGQAHIAFDPGADAQRGLEPGETVFGRIASMKAAVGEAPRAGVERVSP